jgi:hypothetical protein
VVKGGVEREEMPVQSDAKMSDLRALEEVTQKRKGNWPREL